MFTGSMPERQRIGSLREESRPSYPPKASFSSARKAKALQARKRPRIRRPAVFGMRETLSPC
jgi:hypothetical protein